MKYEEFVSLLEDAKAEKKTALDKLADALDALYAAEAKMDYVYAILPESGETYNTAEFEMGSGNLLQDMFSPVKTFTDLFGFGDLF